MAKTCRKGFALKNDFDEIRKYILDGELTPERRNELITLSTDPFFENDGPKLRRKVHILALQWDKSQNHILANVVLFNEINYKIILSKNYTCIYEILKTCHHYDIENLEVKKIPVYNRNLWF